MKTDLEVTVHFLRAFYYYSAGNSIWYIHFKKVKNFVLDMLLNQLIDEVIKEEPSFHTDVYVYSVEGQRPQLVPIEH